ncbi:hypothetical protein Acr_00g0019370 [Actinidia rufa]|uniref:Retrotransposon gag domain-containing protein n=1 Tax=Actinidia rufa TaxID=165716 RepID=A0A7J0DCB9_9ERIC|nr:hypothetical protein Acr_00g0019370 [Actinidia rufa]
MQGVFNAIEQVVKNTMKMIQAPVRAIDSRATTAMKTFLQLRPPTFKGELDPLFAENWLEQITRALDMILVIEEELREVLRMKFINLVQRSMTVAQYEAKFTSLSRFAKAFVLTEEEKTKQFMREFRPSIRNKIAGNLIKVYSTMASQKGPICFDCHQPGHRVVDYPLKGNRGSHNRGGNPIVRENSQGATGSQQPTQSVQASRATLAFTSKQTSYQSKQQAVAQQGQRTLGQVYAMTTVAGPSGTAGQ